MGFNSAFKGSILKLLHEIPLVDFPEVASDYYRPALFSYWLHKTQDNDFHGIYVGADISHPV